MNNKKTSYFSRMLEHMTSQLFIRHHPTIRPMQTQFKAFLTTLIHNQYMDTESLGMMQGVLKIADMQARDIMIPRGDMIIVQPHQSYASIKQTILKSKHSRFPIISDHENHVIGLFLAKKLLYVSEDAFNENTLTSLMIPMTLIPESKRLDQLLKEFKHTHTHMAMVVDEYGEISGLITIEDILELIVGDIEDEEFSETLTIHEITPDHLHISGLCTITEVNKALNTEFPDNHETIGGYIMEQFNYLPRIGEHLTLGPWHITVLKIEKRRIHTLDFKKKKN